MSDSQESEASFGDLPNNFYPPNNQDKEDFEITRTEFEQIKDALKNEQFRKLLTEYVDEVQDPENQKTYQNEVRQLERENGKIVHFLNPIPGYVLKTSVDGQKKCFINICSNPLIRKASAEKALQDSKNGCMWSIPYAQSPVREDVDKSGGFCQVYDVIFNPDVLYLASQNVQFGNRIEKTALDAIQNSFNVTLDINNVKKPKLKYKGMPRATTIKYKIGDKPPMVVDPEAIKSEVPPQSFKNPEKNEAKLKADGAPHKPISKIEKKLSKSEPEEQQQQWTVPRYSLKYRSHVDLQDYCLDNQRSGITSKPIPDEVILTVDLPLLKDSSTLDADVLDDGWNFELKSNEKAWYELKLKLPFKVQCESAKATFEKEKRKLHVTMKTVKMKRAAEHLELSLSDSGDDVFDKETLADLQTGKLNEKGDKGPDRDVGYESHESSESNENIPMIINGNVVVKSILKGSNSNRCRSMSESWVGHLDHINEKEDFMSLESLSESNEQLTMSESSSGDREKSVRFSENIQRQLYRSNSSILGQKKKNQKRNQSKRKNRERHSSEGSMSSFDEDDRHFRNREMESDNKEESSDSNAMNQIPKYKHKKKPCAVGDQ